METPLRLIKGDDDGENGGGLGSGGRWGIRNGEVPNPFDFDKANTYSTEKFYVRAKDANGNSEAKYIKLNPSVLAGISEMIAGRLIPAYKSDGDFIRDAIIHRMRYLAELKRDGRLENVVNRTVMLSRIQAKQMELAELGQVLQLHEEAMETCLRAGDKILMEELISDAEGDLEELRPAYQTRLRVLIDKYRQELFKMPDGDEH